MIARFVLVAALLISGVARADEVDAVKALLAEKHPGKKWDAGPTRMDSKELRAVYPGLRFYAVITGDSPPPGAAIDSIQSSYQAGEKEKARTKITEVVSLDPADRAALYDPNAGLKPVLTKSDVKTACIALATLAHGWMASLGPVEEPKVVIGSHKSGGLSCQLTNVYQTTVNMWFDRQGHVHDLSKVYTGPLPP